MLKVIACGIALILGQPALAETVHSLDQVPGHLKTPQARKYFEEQIEGKPAPDLLGVHLPAVLPASAVVKLLVPDGDTEKPNLIGAEPWPARPNSYVAIVCTGGTAPFQPDEPRCARDAGDETEPPLHVYLGVIEAKDGTAPILVAASAPVDCATNWRNSTLPRQPMAADDAKDGIIEPGSFDQFDLAVYRIAPGQRAFGLRGGWTESYSGGGANFTSLCLFAADGDRLRQVLAVPMSAYSDIAGDWHKDHTRDHDITDAANVLIVSAHSTNGHFDLTVKGGTAFTQRTFRWSTAADAYRPVKD
jgi:hypothetical protein